MDCQGGFTVSLLIGLVVGAVMGLTGAGGALVALPLFINLYHLDLKQATIYSLLTVLIGTFINLIPIWKKAKFQVALPLSLFGVMTSYFTTPLKASLPSSVIIILLILITIFSLKQVWLPFSQSGSSTQNPSFVLTLFLGSLLGVITALTGLGGGVVLLPLLTYFYQPQYEDALPTSLTTIFLIVSFTFLFQYLQQPISLAKEQILWLVIGSIIGLFVLRLLTKKLKATHLLQIRKIVFTLVTIYAVSSLVYDYARRSL